MFVDFLSFKGMCRPKTRVSQHILASIVNGFLAVQNPGISHAGIVAIFRQEGRFDSSTFMKSRT